MKKLAVILSLVFGLSTVLIFGRTAQADGDEPKKSYSVQAILPDNQLNKDVSYYDLKVEPNQKTTLNLLVSNTGQQSINVDVELNNAYTTNSATIGYDKYSATTYKSENPQLSSLVEGKRKQKVKLKAGETKQVSFKIKAPEKEFKGIILGGLTTTAGVSSNEKSKVNVANQIRYVKGVVLHSKEDAVKPDLNLKSAAPNAFDDSVGIAYNVTNEAPININDLKVKAKISHKGLKDTNYKAENLQIAPDSNFQYYIPIKHLKPGIYTTELTFYNEAGFSKTMTNKLKVTQGKIQALDESTQETSSNKTLIFVIVGLIGILFIGLWVFFYVTGKKIR